MKIKLVVVDLEVPANVKKWGIRLGIPAAAVLAGGIAWAAGLPTFTTWTSGQTLAAADLNNNFANLQQQITTTTYATRVPSAFSATDSENGGAVVVPMESEGSPAILFDTVAFDLGGELDTTTGTFTPQNDGLYWLSCQGEFFTGQSGPYGYKMLIKKGGADILGQDEGSPGSNYGGLAAATSGIVALKAGDQITCSAWASNPSGTTLDANGTNQATFSGARLY